RRRERRDVDVPPPAGKRRRARLSARRRNGRARRKEIERARRGDVQRVRIFLHEARRHEAHAAIEGIAGDEAREPAGGARRSESERRQHDRRREADLQRSDVALVPLVRHRAGRARVRRGVQSEGFETRARRWKEIRRAGVKIRLATAADIPRIEAIMRESMKALGAAFYDERQTASAVEHIAIPDPMLIDDATYFVVED